MAEIPGKLSFQLKTMQDLAVYAHLRDFKDMSIAEIGGAASTSSPSKAPTMARKARSRSPTSRTSVQPSGVLTLS